MKKFFKGLILAAGKGSRFQAESGEPSPKVLRELLGKPLVSYVIDALSKVGIEDITLIVGYRSDDVKNAMGNKFSYVLQTEQKGSGHAVACAKKQFEGFDGEIVIMCGDSPLFKAETLSKMMAEHEKNCAAVTLASAILDDPFGYGRIERNSTGKITGIVEEKCADAEQRLIKEVNGGAYIFNSIWLFGNIEKMALNDAGEYNLTDMVRVALEQNKTVSAVKCSTDELLGVNTPTQLKTVEKIVKSRL